MVWSIAKVSYQCYVIFSKNHKNYKRNTELSQSGPWLKHQELASEIMLQNCNADSGNVVEFHFISDKNYTYSVQLYLIGSDLRSKATGWALLSIIHWSCIQGDGQLAVPEPHSAPCLISCVSYIHTEVCISGS